MKYLVRMFERKEGYWRYRGVYEKPYYSPESIKNHFFEVEVEDTMDKYDFYKKMEETYPNLKYGNRYPLKDTLPNGWKKLKGALTAPNGYYWASNGKSFFDKNIERALIVEHN